MAKKKMHFLDGLGLAPGGRWAKALKINIMALLSALGGFYEMLTDPDSEPGSLADGFQVEEDLGAWLRFWAERWHDIWNVYAALEKSGIPGASKRAAFDASVKEKAGDFFGRPYAPRPKHLDLMRESMVALGDSCGPHILDPDGFKSAERLGPAD